MDESTLYNPDGLVLTSCPKFLALSPAVSEVREMAAWLSRGCLDPRTLPVMTRKAVIAWSSSYERGKWDRFEKDRPANERTGTL